MQGERTCSRCGESKSLTEFYRRGRNGGRSHSSACKLCVKAQLAKYDERRRRNGRRRTSAEHRKKRLKQYGLTPDQYEAILDRQNGGCAICGNPDSGSGLSLPVDHCHASGAVRGILCRGCNVGLGSFDDDPDRLRAAARYLEQSPTA